jgi:hypothetical protein
VKKLFGLNHRAIIGAAVGLSIATIFFVAYKQHRAAEKYKAHREEYCSSIIATTEQKKSCEEEGASARDYLPWGYELVAWPEGITTWAIILTGFAIAWQSWETRKSARATRDAIILQHRPKIVVRSLTLVRDKSSNFEVVLVIRNSGSTIAYLSESTFMINWILSGQVAESHQDTIKAMSLKPGEIHQFRFTAPQFYIRFAASQVILETNPSQIQTAFLCCFTYLSYHDEIGTRRDTALNRTYDSRKKEFVVWNLEADYSD